MVPTLAIRTKSSPGIPSSKYPTCIYRSCPPRGQLVRASRGAVIGQASPLGLRGLALGGSVFTCTPPLSGWLRLHPSR